MQEIILNANKIILYLCDRKDRCNKSPRCGKECVLTLDKKHSAETKHIDIFELKEGLRK